VCVLKTMPGSPARSISGIVMGIVVILDSIGSAVLGRPLMTV
jgi:hypothetical protein